MDIGSQIRKNSRSPNSKEQDIGQSQGLTHRSDWLRLDIKNHNMEHQYGYSVTHPQSHQIETGNLIPSFRSHYQLHELTQQLSEAKRIIDMKNKQIFYFSNQIVSIKDEYTHKIIQFENIIAQNKRQLTELRYSGLKNKRTETQKLESMLEESKKNYQLMVFSLKQGNEQLLKKLQNQHTKQMQNIEQKYLSLISFEKNQKNVLKQVVDHKDSNYQTMITQMQTQITKMYKQRESQSYFMKKQEIQITKMKDDFNTFCAKAENVEKTLKIQVQKISTDKQFYEKECAKFENSLINTRQKCERISQEFKEEVGLLKEEISKFKQLLAIKDKQIAKITQSQRVESGKQNQILPDPTRSCNHIGLIKQLQNNIKLKVKQNQELKQQLNHWGNFIGFQKTYGQKISDLLNASQEALHVQQSFSNTIRKKYTKLDE